MCRPRVSGVRALSVSPREQQGKGQASSLRRLIRRKLLQAPALTMRMAMRMVVLFGI
jgi:hypothetical protein